MKSHTFYLLTFLQQPYVVNVQDSYFAQRWTSLAVSEQMRMHNFGQSSHPANLPPMVEAKK